VWAADAYYTNALAGALPAGGMMDFGPIAIANTTDPQIFQTEHYCMSSYNIPLTNATYTVNLYFAESYFTGPGQNVFDVNVAGQSLTNLDIYALVGPHAALVKTFNNVSVTTGTLTITFTPQLKCPHIDGIEIIPSSGTTGTTTNPPPTVNAGSNQTITLPASATLDGTASGSGTITTTWSKSSGPGTVTFGNVNAVSTTASFSTSGSYVLSLTATNAFGTSTSNVTITVNPAPTCGVTVSGTHTLMANVTSSVGIAGVQFTLDGANFGSNVTIAPYSMPWNTTTASNGCHVITATATDALGNKGSASISASVVNP